VSKQASAPPGRRAGPAQSPYHHPAGLVAVSLVTSVWILLYALYRGYYAVGGTVGMIGTFRSASEWRDLNLAGAVILLAVAVLPVTMLPLWRRPGVRRILLGVCWVLAVGFIMHALVQDVQRILSLTGHLQLSYPPLWKTLNRHAADIQDLAFNETWFLITGLLWGVVGWIALGPSRARRWWTWTALAAIAVLTLIGLFTAVGVIGRSVIG
jgi:hypothetical protein